MKRKLLFVALCVVSALSFRANAQTDVTKTHLTNPDFSSGAAIDNNVCTYGKDMAGNGTTYYGAQAIDGWTNASVGEANEGYENCKLAGAVFAYGSEPWLAGAGTPAPATDPDGGAGKAAGLCAVWGGTIRYTQNVTLPKGSYTVVFKVYNSTKDYGSGKIITANLFGFESEGGTAYYAPNNTFAIGQWSTVAVTFNLDEETSGKISMGYTGPSGNANMPHLFVDNVKILQNTDYQNVTDKVNFRGWTNAGDGYANDQQTDAGMAPLARNYGVSAEGQVLSQTITGLKKGTYEAAVYCYSQMEWKDVNTWLTHDAGDVGYVGAEGATTVQEWINARRGPGYPADGPGIYTLSGIEVGDDGELTISYNLAQKDQTEWHAIQIKSLIYTKNLDLSEFISAYEKALADAQEMAATTEDVAPSVLAALNTTRNTYAKGKVDETDEEDLETAIDALNKAMAAVKTSIASYKIIESGSIPDNSLEGWTCENTNAFQINTWSTESGPVGNDTRPSYDGTGMTVPFIQNWVARGSYLGEGKVYYKLEGLEPGEVYYAQALVRSYNEANADVPNGPNFFINDAVTDMTEAGTSFTFSGMSGIYATLGGAATVGSDGTLTLGVKIATDRNYNWVAFKSVSIRPMADALAAAVADAALVEEGTIPEAAYAELQGVVATNNKTYATAAEYETAIGAINDATTKAAAMVIPYANWQLTKAEAVEVAGNDATMNTQIQGFDAKVEAATTAEGITKVVNIVNELLSGYDLCYQAKALAAVPYVELEAGANETFKAAVTTQVNAALIAASGDDEETAIAGIDDAFAKVKKAMKTYVFAANPQEDYQFDLTFLLTNPDLTGLPNRKPAEGWYNDQHEPAQNSQVMSENPAVANSEDPTKYTMYEYWSDKTEVSEGYVVYLKATLPAGTYEMDALCMTGYGYNTRYPSEEGRNTNITFSAGEGDDAVDGKKITTETLEPYTLTFRQKAENEVKIGLKAQPGNTSNWMGIGYVHLYKQFTDYTQYDINLISDEFEAVVTVNGTEVQKSLALEQVTVTVTNPDPEGINIEVTAEDADGEAIDVINLGNDVYTFQQPRSNVKVTVQRERKEIVVKLYKPTEGSSETHGMSTFIAPYDVDISDKNYNKDIQAAYTVKGVENGELVMTEVEDGLIPAYTPVILECKKTKSVIEVTFNDNVEKPTKTAPYTEGLLTGVLTETYAPVGKYVLQNQDDGLAFYRVDKEKTIKVPAYKAYLTMEGSAAKAIFFPGEDEEANAIAALDVLTSGYDGIYTANGVQVNALQKGLNIVKKGGKSYKIFVK